MSTAEPVLALDARMELGESPVWDDRTGTLLFVDILRGMIARFDTSARVDLSPAELESEPHAGGVFVLRPGVTGRTRNRFAG